MEQGWRAEKQRVKKTIPSTTWDSLQGLTKYIPGLAWPRGCTFLGQWCAESWIYLDITLGSPKLSKYIPWTEWCPLQMHLLKPQPSIWLCLEIGPVRKSIWDAIRSTSGASLSCLNGRMSGLMGMSKVPVSVRDGLSQTRKEKLLWKVCLHPHLKQGGTPPVEKSHGCRCCFFLSYRWELAVPRTTPLKSIFKKLGQVWSPEFKKDIPDLLLWYWMATVSFGRRGTLASWRVS